MFAVKPKAVVAPSPVKIAPAKKSASKLMESSDEDVKPAPKSAQRVVEVEVVKQPEPVKQAEPAPVFKPAKVDVKEVSPERLTIA